MLKDLLSLQPDRSHYILKEILQKAPGNHRGADIGFVGTSIGYEHYSDYSIRLFKIKRKGIFTF